jgi:prophage regulatory protein
LGVDVSPTGVGERGTVSEELLRQWLDGEIERARFQAIRTDTLFLSYDGRFILRTRMAPVIEQRVPAKLDRLLDKWAVEALTSLDITTIYRKIKAGTFPKPVRVGKRRVAWRESDLVRWQNSLSVSGKL